ncbi:uncharacterized protein RHO25_012384 [Cercospora beticola]|uniref:Uncharacterized protein n=1 Tax=Cercospora beticola TaxID=122368 RepID=A0ABZ0P751_CERBT|nr:hypothetical protein RHO25_012384 [Cercospora beticola]
MRLQHKRCRRTSRRSAETSTSIGPSQGLRLLTARPHSTSIRRSLVISMAKQPEASHSAALSSDKIKPPPATFRPQPHPRTSSLQPTANLTAKEDVTSASQLAITNLEKPARPQRRPSFDRSNLNAFLLSQIAHDTGWISTKREPRAMRNTTVNNKPTALFVDDSTLGTSTSAANCADGSLSTRASFARQGVHLFFKSTFAVSVVLLVPRTGYIFADGRSAVLSMPTVVGAPSSFARLGRATATFHVVWSSFVLPDAPATPSRMDGLPQISFTDDACWCANPNSA